VKETIAEMKVNPTQCPNNPHEHKKPNTNSESEGSGNGKLKPINSETIAINLKNKLTQKMKTNK
jgi:hypothetical protein